MHSDSLITRRANPEADAIAPDGSEVRLLCRGERGSMAQFLLPPGRISRAVQHRSVEEIWYFLSGSGRMWRAYEETDLVIEASAGLCLTIPVGAKFQFRSDGPEPLVAIGITMPSWPGPDEAIFVEGIWQADS